MAFSGKGRGREPFHPPKEPEYFGLPTVEGLKAAFAACADFSGREVRLAGWERLLRLFWLDGMVKSERLNDYVIRPLAAGPMPRTGEEAKALLEGGIWNLQLQRQETLEGTVRAVLGGSVAVFAGELVLTCSVESEEKRSISPPEDETAAKGAKDAFVESVRTNTGMLRRHLRSAHLKIKELELGRESHTAVDLLWMEGITDDALLRRIEEQVRAVDIDALLTTGDFEEYVGQRHGAVFPQMVFTERPDRFCRGLLDGRAGVLIEGIPLGGLMPGDLAQFLEAAQDRVYHWGIATATLLLRYFCLLLTLLLPGLYIAVASFHFEMIPTRLAMSIIASKQNVPFSTPFEVLMLLTAFEILQEAGLRLPKTIGQTVSIIGGLVVGQAAVDAKILSPAVVIVVAAAGIAGFTMPNQDLANALRIWRFFLALLSGLAGLFGLAVGLAFLIARLAEMESFGVAYLAPFVYDPGHEAEHLAVLRQPIPEIKMRDLYLKPKNRRRQK